MCPRQQGFSAYPLHTARLLIGYSAIIAVGVSYALCAIVTAMHALAALLLLALASPSLCFYESNSAVKALDPAALAKLRELDSVHLVEFYAPWCT